jgi:hypothetical protein
MAGSCEDNPARACRAAGADDFRRHRRAKGALSLITVIGEKWQFVETGAHRGARAIKVDFGMLGKGLFRSGDGSSLVRRVKDCHVELFAVALPDDFVHFHAGLKFENHKALSQADYISRPIVNHTNVTQSAQGHSRRFPRILSMSALAPTADAPDTMPIFTLGQEQS